MLLPLVARLRNRETGSAVKGNIRHVTQTDIRSWREWKYREDDQDSDWDWEAIISDSMNLRSQFECYALNAEGTLQGLMSLDMSGRRMNDETYLVVDYG